MSNSPIEPSSQRIKKSLEPKKVKVDTEENVGGLISDELEIALHTMFVDARIRRLEFLSVEHLLFGLLDIDAPRETLVACGANLDELKLQLTLHIDENTPVVDGQTDVDTQPTLGLQRVIQRAIMKVQAGQNGKNQVFANDVLISIFSERDSHAVYFLHQQGITRLDVVNYLSYGIVRTNGAKANERSADEILNISYIQSNLNSILTEKTPSVGKIGSKKQDQPKLFISYSHTDTTCLERLLVHLKPLERANTVVCWSDRRIRTGDKWRTELEKNLDDSVIAILLVSADFLASDFIVNNELPPLLVKADANGLRILPVILKPCGFRRDPLLSTFQAANDPNSPLLGMTEMEQEALYDKIAEEVAKELRGRRAR